jgi:hypothetical protein
VRARAVRQPDSALFDCDLELPCVGRPTGKQTQKRVQPHRLTTGSRTRSHISRSATAKTVPGWGTRTELSRARVFSFPAVMVVHGAEVTLDGRCTRLCSQLDLAPLSVD